MVCRGLGLRVSNCQIFMEPFVLPLTKVWLSGLKAIDFTQSAFWSVKSCLPVFRFQSLIVLSALPLASNLPLALIAIAPTSSLCPSRVLIRVFVSRFHSLIRLSQLPLARIRPSTVMARGCHRISMTFEGVE